MTDEQLDALARQLCFARNESPDGIQARAVEGQLRTVTFLALAKFDVAVVVEALKQIAPPAVSGVRLHTELTGEYGSNAIVSAEIDGREIELIREHIPTRECSIDHHITASGIRSAAS